MEKLEWLYIVGGVHNVSMENSIEVPQSITGTNYHIIQQPH
jgi:hypothetical protein